MKIGFTHSFATHFRYEFILFFRRKSSVETNFFINFFYHFYISSRDSEKLVKYKKILLYLYLWIRISGCFSFSLSGKILYALYFGEHINLLRESILSLYSLSII